METVTDFIFLGSEINVDGDCNHEIKITTTTKKHLFFGRKAMTNLDNVLKSRDNTLPTNVHIVKAMVFPVVHGVTKSQTWLSDRITTTTSNWNSVAACGI